MTAAVLERPGGTDAAPCSDVAGDVAPDVGAEVGARIGATLVSAAHQVLSAAAGAERWTAADRRRTLAELDRVTGVLAVARARVLTAEHAAGTWALHGDKDLTAWRARTSRDGVRAALGQVRQAETIAAMGQVEDALTAGTIGTAHVDQIARFTATACPAVAAHARTSEGQSAIVALASRVDGSELGGALTRWQAELDPSARQRTHDRQQAARYLNLSQTPDGTHVKGLLDSVAGHRLRLALEAVTPHPAVDDERTSEQRRADALVLLADRALDDAPTAGPVNRPHVSLVLTEPTWQALRARRAQRRPEAEARSGPTYAGTRTPSGTGTPPVHSGDELLRREPEPASGAATDSATSRAGAPPERDGDTLLLADPESTSGAATHVARSLTGAPPACDEDGRPWPASELARALCDCHLTRVVVDADSVPIDLGRTQRLFSAAQRRAVTVRDGGCGWPGCGAPARWCELHHITWWDRDGGATDLDNAVALCSFHHHQVHRRDLSITRRPPERPSPEGSRDGPPSDHRRPGPDDSPARSRTNPGPMERGRARYRFTTQDGRDAVTLRPPG